MPVDDQTTVGREAVSFYQRLLRYLRTAVEGMDGDLLAWRPAPDTTAISNIVLHIVGSTRGCRAGAERPDRAEPADYRQRGRGGQDPALDGHSGSPLADLRRYPVHRGLADLTRAEAADPISPVRRARC